MKKTINITSLQSNAGLPSKPSTSHFLISPFHWQLYMGCRSRYKCAPQRPQQYKVLNLSVAYMHECANLHTTLGVFPGVYMPTL